MKNKHKGKVLSEETKEKIRKARKNQVFTKDIIQKRSKKLQKSVYQYDLNGNFIREWNSIKEASIYYKCNQSNISKVILNKQNSAKGFKWKLKQENK